MSVAQHPTCTITGIPIGHDLYELNNYERLNPHNGVIVGRTADGRIKVQFCCSSIWAIPAQYVHINQQRVEIGPQMFVIYQPKGIDALATVEIDGETAGQFTVYRDGSICIGRNQPAPTAASAVQHIIDNYHQRKASTRNAAAALGVVA